jgi:RND family efflux transporter MFP subunit
MIACKSWRAVLPVLLATCLPAAAGEFVVAPTVVDETKAVFGQVESRDVVPARARISGTVREIAVEEGSQVTAGQVIAVVVDEKLALERDAADADIKALQSQLDNARLELDRATQLLAKAAIPKSQVDQAQTKVDVLVNQLGAANARRAVIGQQASEGAVLAPLSGRVLSVPIARDSVVMAGDTIVRIAGGGYFLRLSLPERHAADIRQGGKVQVGRRLLSASSEAPEAIVQEGTVVKVYPEIVGGRILADVEVGDLGDYFVGERTLVWVPIGRRTVLAVPRTAVTTRHGVDYVRIEGDGGELDVAVVLGEAIPGDRVEVLSGLIAGDRVVLP